MNSFKSYSLSPRKKGIDTGVNWKFEKIKNLAPTSVSSKKPDTKNISFQVYFLLIVRHKTWLKIQMNLMIVKDNNISLLLLPCIEIVNKYIKSKKLWVHVGLEKDNIMHQYLLILHH